MPASCERGLIFEMLEADVFLMEGEGGGGSSLRALTRESVDAKCKYCSPVIHQCPC